MKIILYLLSCTLTVAAFTSCRENNASPIRNVRFDPDLLNKMRVAGKSCTSYSYEYGGKPQRLGTIYTKQVLVTFDAALSAEEQEQAAAKYGFVKGLGAPFQTSSAVLQPLVLQDGLSCSQVEQVLVELAADPHITYAAPYFAAGGAQLLGLSNEALVTIEEGALYKLQKLAEAYKAEVLQPLSNNTYLVRVDKLSAGNALQLANALRGQAGILHAEPDFLVAALSTPIARPLLPVGGAFTAE